MRRHSHRARRYGEVARHSRELRVSCSISKDMKYVFLFEIDLYEIQDRRTKTLSRTHTHTPKWSDKLYTCTLRASVSPRFVYCCLPIADWRGEVKKIVSSSHFWQWHQYCYNQMVFPPVVVAIAFCATHNTKRDLHMDESDFDRHRSMCLLLPLAALQQKIRARYRGYVQHTRWYAVYTAREMMSSKILNKMKIINI